MENKEFKNFVSSKDEVKKEIIKEEVKIDPSVKGILKEHIMLKEGLSDTALVSLIVKYNGHDLNEDSVHELKLFNLIDDSKNITDSGKEFINLDETITRLKNMVD